MLDFLSVGDTSHNVFLEMTDETATIKCRNNEATCELCFPWGDKVPVQALHDTIGGNSANAAVAFARLCAKTGFYTHVGHDDQGERIISTLKKEGVHTDYVVTDADLGSNFSTVINLHGERTILVYHEHRHYRMPKAEAAKWVYFSSMGEGSDSIFPDLIAYMREHGSNLCYQPGTFQLKMGLETTRELLAACKVILMNKEEAELYLGIAPTSDFRVHLDGLRALGPEIVMVSDGPKGAYATDGTEYLGLGIIKDAPRTEATGAGDAFSSGFTAALSEGRGLGEALRWGQAESSGCIQMVGPQAGLLTRDRLEKVLAAYPNLKPQPLGEELLAAEGAYPITF